MADPAEGAGRTGVHASKAQVAPVAVDIKRIVFGQGGFLTGFQAGAAGDALSGVEGDFRPRALALRVMAPAAGKRAAFKKNHGPDTRSVVQRIALYFQDKRRLQWLSLFAGIPSQSPTG